MPIRWYFKDARRKFKADVRNLEITEGESILYVGGFVLPDCNAAAHRVLANARILRDLGYDVAFLNYSEDAKTPHITEYFGFTCFECPSREWNGAIGRMDIDRVEEVAGILPGLFCIIAYNYPSPALAKLIRFCRKRGITCVGDVTEWYSARDVSPVKAPLKFVDTAWRMHILNKRMDGLIVISRYLESCYRGKVPTVVLPPLVDAGDPKWANSSQESHAGTRLIYAGRPSKTKERLDLIVEAVLAQDFSDGVTLDVVGVTEEGYRSIYGSVPKDSRIHFLGRVSHEEALRAVKDADYSVVVRDDNRVTRAGFPTKFAESVTCGTPVICNANSDLADWARRGCGVLVDENGLVEGIREAVRNRVAIADRRLFDYRRFEESMKRFMEVIRNR